MMHKMISSALLFPPPLEAYFSLRTNGKDADEEPEQTHLERTQSMNPSISMEEQLEIETQGQAPVTETDLLAQCGFSAEEIVSLLWLRQWYQTGGSDRAQIVRHLEFLKLLILNGKIEV